MQKMSSLSVTINKRIRNKIATKLKETNLFLYSFEYIWTFGKIT